MADSIGRLGGGGGDGIYRHYGYFLAWKFALQVYNDGRMDTVITQRRGVEGSNVFHSQSSEVRTQPRTWE